MNSLTFAPFPILITERLLLRQLHLDDHNEIYFIRTDSELNRYVNKPKTNSIDDAKNFIEKINHGISHNEWIYWVICMKETGQFAGTICFWNLDIKNNTAEVGYTLLMQFQGKGIMSEALNKVIRYGFLEMKLNSIVAYPHTSNKNSVKLLDRFNFKRINIDPNRDVPDEIGFMLSSD